jgi:hypothetical protein
MTHSLHSDAGWWPRQAPSHQRSSGVSFLALLPATRLLSLVLQSLYLSPWKREEQVQCRRQQQQWLR